MNLISRTNKQTKIVKTIILFFFLFFSFQISVRAAVNCSSLTNSGTVTISWTDSYCFFGQPGNASNTSGAADDATYTNNGTISLRYRNVRGFYNGFDNTKMINNGTIESNAQHRYGYQSAFHDEGDDGESINNGTINLDYGASGGNGNNGAFRMNIGSGQSFTNSSGASVTVIGSNGNPGGLIQSDNTTVTNNGTFTIGGSGTTQKAIRYYDTADGQTLINTGTITQSGSTDAILNEGTNAVITNTGTINGSVYDINNTGTITTLENDQGGNDALIFDGAVPTNYNIIVNSVSDFGKITFNGTETGTMSFGIKSGSTVGLGTYSGVLQSLAEARLSGTTGTFSTYKWTLSEDSSGTWDMVIANARTGYKVRIKKAKLSSIATLLESFNTDGKKSTLTTNLDSLSDAALEKAMKQIKGMTIQKSLGQGIRSNNNFKRAMTGAISTPSFGNMVKNNFANLTNGDIQNYYNPGVLNNVTLTNDFTFVDIAAIYKNRNLLTLGTPESSLYVRTFGGTTNQDKIGDDVGYQNNTAGIIFGNQAAINDLQTGWGVGFSTNGLDYDEGMGLSNTHTLHTNFFMNKDYENFGTSFNFGSFIAANNLTRNVTEGSTQTLKADTTDIGFDMTFGISKNINLGGWIINPSVSMNTSYLIQDDIKESGGDLALDIQTDNLLQIKPELGFNLDREFSSSALKSRQFNFSLFGSEENKLDGSDSRATIVDTGDGYAMIDDRKKDKFLTAGLGYTSLNNSNNSQLIFNIFTTQNEQNDMNSSLLSFTYNKKF